MGPRYGLAHSGCQAVTVVGEHHRVTLLATRNQFEHVVSAAESGRKGSAGLVKVNRGALQAIVRDYQTMFAELKEHVNAPDEPNTTNHRKYR